MAWSSQALGADLWGLCGRSGQEVTRIAQGSEPTLFSSERGSRHDTSSDQSLLRVAAERLCCRFTSESASTSSVIREQGLAVRGMKPVHPLLSQSACLSRMARKRRVVDGCPLYNPTTSGSLQVTYKHDKGRGKRAIGRSAEEDPGQHGPCGPAAISILQATTGGSISGDPELQYCLPGTAIGCARLVLLGSYQVATDTVQIRELGHQPCAQLHIIRCIAKCTSRPRVDLPGSIFLQRGRRFVLPICFTLIFLIPKWMDRPLWRMSHKCGSARHPPAFHRFS